MHQNQFTPSPASHLTPVSKCWRAGLFAGTFAAAALLAACGGGGGSSEPVVTPITPPPVAIASKAKYQVVLLNAVDGSRITDEITVSFSGDAKLIDSEGNQLNGKTLKTKDGVVSFGAEFTGGKNDFSVQAGNRVIGWTETGTRVVGDGAVVGTQTVELKLLNINAAAAITADPTKAIASAVSVVSGFTTAATVASPTKTVTNSEGVAEQAGSASVSFAPGTKAVDPVTGAVVPIVGAVTVSATMYANSEVSSLSAFPGGFAANVVAPASATGSAGGADSGTFITGGFAQFNATDSTGKALKQFDKPMTLAIDLPKSSLDPDGNPVVAGSTYPVWSYDDATGQWKFEREGVIREKSPVDPNNFTVVFESNHLSSWNLDYYQASCTATVTLGRGTDVRPLRVEISGIPGRRYANVLSSVRDSVQTIRRTPRQNLMVKVFDGTLLVGQTPTPVNLCGGVNIALNLPQPALGTIAATVTEACANGANRRPLPTFVRVEQTPNFDAGYATISGDVAQANFAGKKVGPARVFAFNKYTNSYAEQTVQVPLNATVAAPFNFTMPCAGVTGAGS